MFDNIGAKLMTAARVLCWVGIGASVLGGFIMFIAGAMNENTAGIISGLTVMAAGSVLSYLGSLCLYALGEIAENSDIRTNLAVKAEMEKVREKQPSAAPKQDIAEQ